MNTTLMRLMFAVITTLVSYQIQAHRLKQTTAKVILRDGQIEIRIQTDLVNWKNQLQDNQAWLLGDINEVLPQNLTDAQQLDFLKTQLGKQTLLGVKGKNLPLKLIEFPQNMPPSHGHYVDIVLSSQHYYEEVEQLSVQFPKALGPVYTSFVRPQYHMIAAGKKSQVSFLERNKTVVHTNQGHSHSPKR